MDTYYEIYHHGTKGQRWGNRLYQNKDGSLTPLGRIRYAKQQKTRRKNLEKARLAKSAKAKAEADKKKAEEDEKTAKEKFEADKKKAIESGSATDVIKFKGKLTTSEMQTALNRINLEKQLSDLSAKERKSAVDKIAKVMDKVGTIRNATEKGIDAYNTAAKIFNSFSKDKKLPKIQDKDNNKNDGKQSDDIKKRLMRYWKNLKKQVINIGII